MSPITIGLIGIGVLFVLLFLKMPVGLVMALVGAAGFFWIRGLDPTLGVLRTTPYTTFASYGLSIIPLFILMGTFCFFAGISEDLYAAAYAWLSRFRGGLAMATVAACAGFAAICGSTAATAATMGKIALPEMKRYGYDKGLAAGAVAAGGTIGILIPPSVILVIYAILTEQSIGRLLLAGFIPGVLEAVFYFITIYILCKRNPQMGPAGPTTSFRQKVVAVKGVWMILVLFVVVMGGIYFGIFSPTEAAGIGAFGAFIFLLGRRRLTWQVLKDSLFDTGKTTAMIFLIMMGAMIFGYFLAVSRLPFEMAGYIVGLGIHPNLVLALILVFYLVLGCLMDSMAMILITVPVFFPVIMALGFDPIWFGIIIVRVCEIGLITPPVGLNVYIIKGIAGEDTSMFTIFRGIVPFLIADLCHVSLLIAVPQLALFLPTHMF